MKTMLRIIRHPVSVCILMFVGLPIVFGECESIRPNIIAASIVVPLLLVAVTGSETNTEKKTK